MLRDNHDEEHEKEGVAAIGPWISSCASQTVILIRELVTFHVSLITYTEQWNNNNQRKQVKGETVLLGS